jgi:hypothetical protein
VSRPDRSPQQQRSVAIKTRVLAIQLVSFLKRHRHEAVIAKRGSCLSDSYECLSPEYGSNVIPSSQYRIHRAERDSRLPQRSRAMRELHLQFMP